MNRRFSFGLGLLVLVVLFGTGLLRADDGKSEGLSAAEIVKRMRDVRSMDNSESSVVMILENSRGNRRERRIRSWRRRGEGGLSANLVRFLEPSDVRGTGLLSLENESRDDDQFLYLPALGKSRRITSSQKKKSFMGTDFSYEDMENRDVDQDEHVISGEEVWQGYACYIIESRSKDVEFQYSRVVFRVGKEHYIPWHGALYDHQGKLWKEFTCEEVREVEGRWVVTRSKMENVQKNHRTILMVEEIQFRDDLPEDIFTVRNLEKE